MHLEITKSFGITIVSANLMRLNFAIKTNVILLESSKTTVKQSANGAPVSRNYYNTRKITPFSKHQKSTSFTTFFDNKTNKPQEIQRFALENGGS